MLRKPKPIYFVVGKTLNVIFNKNICHKIIDLFLYFDRYVFLEKREFIAGERFGIKPKYILMVKQNYYYYFFNIEEKKHYTKVFTYEDMINEIDNIYGIKEYKIVEFKETPFIAIEIK